VRPDLVVVPSPILDDDPGLADAVEDLAAESLSALRARRSSSRRRALKLSQEPFSQGEPGSM
jgi:hypothetical protein